MSGFQAMNSRSNVQRTGEISSSPHRQAAPTSRFYDNYRLQPRKRSKAQLTAAAKFDGLGLGRPTSRLLDAGHMAHMGEVVVHEAPGAALGRGMSHYAPLATDQDALAAAEQRLLDRGQDPVEIIAEAPLMDGRSFPGTLPMQVPMDVSSSAHVVPAAVVERIAEQLLKRFSLGVTKSGGAARMEFGEGAFMGAAVLVEQDGDLVRVVVSSDDEQTARKVARALSARFARNGQEVEVEVD